MPVGTLIFSILRQSRICDCMRRNIVPNFPTHFREEILRKSTTQKKCSNPMVPFLKSSQAI